MKIHAFDASRLGPVSSFVVPKPSGPRLQSATVAPQGDANAQQLAIALVQPPAPRTSPEAALLAVIEQTAKDFVPPEALAYFLAVEKARLARGYQGTREEELALPLPALHDIFGATFADAQSELDKAVAALTQAGSPAAAVKRASIR